MAGGAVANLQNNSGTAQSLSQLNTILNQLGGGAGGGANQSQFGALPALTNLGANMMKPGMQAPAAPPLPRPVMGAGMGPGVPVPQGSMPGGGMPGMGAGQGMPLSLMNLMMSRQGGMM